MGAMSLRNPNIWLYVIDLDKDRELVGALSVRTVPSFAVGDAIVTSPPNEWILAQMMARKGRGPG